MDSRLLVFLLASAFLVLCTQPLLAQTTAVPQWQLNTWQRGGATIDLDFYNDRYFLSGSSCAPCTGVANFITAAGASFTRASVGTYFNSSGVLTTATSGTPRFDHSPVSPYTPYGILIEENRTNSNIYSSSLANSSYWNLNGGTLNHSTTAPDGSTAYSVVATGQFQGVWYGWVPAASTTYAISTFAKNVSGGSLIEFGSDKSCFGSGPYSATVMFNTVTGAFSSPSSGVTSYSAQQLSNGWWRLNIVATAGTASGCNASEVNYSMNGATASENAFWGDQIEIGASPTSYIPTSGSAVTRSQGVFTVPGSAGSGWLRNNVGTLGTVGSVLYLSGNMQGFAGVDDGTASNSIFTAVNSSQKRTAVTYVSGTQYGGTLSPNTSYTLGKSTKIAIAFSTAGGGFQGGAADNGAFLDGTFALPATQNRLTVGHSRGALGDLDGWVSRIWYMPVTEPDYTLPNFTQ